MRKTLIALSSALLFAAAYASYAAGPPPMAFPQQAPTVSQITGLFSGDGNYLKKDGTTETPGGTGDVVGPATSTQYKIPLWGAADKTLVDGVAVGTEGMVLRSAGAGANPAWSAYTLALPGSAGAVLYSDGTNWTRSTAPSLLALTLYGQSAGGGAQLALGSSSGSSDPNNGKMLFRNATNGYLFTITSGVSGADISWTLPTAAPGGANYLLNVDADGTMGYTDPSSLGGGYTNLTSFVDQTAWRLFYSDGSGDVKELSLGSDGTYLRSNGASAAPTFDTPTGGAHDAVTLSTDLGNNLLGLSTQQITLDNQTANYVFAGPTTGAAAAPQFRAFAAADLGTTLTPQFARVGFGMAADGTNPIASTGFSVDADGDVTAKSVTVTKVSGEAGKSLLYEANSTDVNGTGWKGPASRASDLYLQFPDADPAANQFLLFPAPTTGTATAAWQTYGVFGSLTWLLTGTPDAAGEADYNSGNLRYYNTALRTVVNTDEAQTLTNKTFDANATGNVLKGYGFITFTKPHNRGSATAAVGTTETTQLYGVPAFADDVESNNYVDYIAEVPRDIDTNVDLVAYFKFRLGGADTGDHDYAISMVSIADSAVATGTPATAVDLAYTADGSGADGDIETATATLTDWKSNVTAGNYWLIRVTRDGDDGTNDTSTVDSYPMSLTIRYGFTQ